MKEKQRHVFKSSKFKVQSSKSGMSREWAVKKRIILHPRAMVQALKSCIPGFRSERADEISRCASRHRLISPIPLGWETDPKPWQTTCFVNTATGYFLPIPPTTDQIDTV